MLLLLLPVRAAGIETGTRLGRCATGFDRGTIRAGFAGDGDVSRPLSRWLLGRDSAAVLKASSAACGVGRANFDPEEKLLCEWFS